MAGLLEGGGNSNTLHRTRGERRICPSVSSAAAGAKIARSHVQPPGPAGSPGAVEFCVGREEDAGELGSDAIVVPAAGAAPVGPAAAAPPPLAIADEPEPWGVYPAAANVGSSGSAGAARPAAPPRLE